MKNTATIPESEIHGVSPITEAVRLVVDFFKWRFSELPAGAYHYDPTDGPESNSEIYIGSESPIEVEKVGQRPAITVLRAPAVFSGLHIGDLGYIDMKTGAEVFMDLLPTTITVTALSRTPVEAESIAWFCSTQYRAFWKQIVRKSNGLMLTTGQKISISSITPAGSLVNDATGDWSAVVLAIPMFLQHAVTRYPMNRRILGGITSTIRPK